MNKFTRFLIVLLTMTMGGLFLYSAYTKLFPTIQSFEYTIVEFTHIPLLYAKILARFFVSLEAGLGTLIIFHLWGNKKWVLKFALYMLIVFSTFLIYLWIKAGNNVNCGCFGDNVFMSPSVSLIKNILMISALVLILRKGRSFTYRWVHLTAAGLLIAIGTTIYLVFPVYEIYKINLTSLYKDPKWTPAINLAKGKHLVAFLSPSCSHCRKAATKMHGMYTKNPAIPFYIILGGVESDLTDFWKETQAQDMPFTRLNKDEFLQYTKGVFPQIFWLNNSWVEENTNYPELDQKLIEKWMK